MGPGDLRAMMMGLERSEDPAVLVGTETSDDAGVYRVSDTSALVCTADFITPVVDDPYLFGQVAAANSLSDIYAMGGDPKAALALCMFPKALDPGVAREILAGGQAKVKEAGAVVLGGHTVRGPELLYGFSVTGLIDPSRIVRNVGARPGDRVILTKPLGSGMIINGLRRQALTQAAAQPMLEALATLNRQASAAMVEALPAVHAATDVTGFGLVGHALEMAVGSGVTLRLELAVLPSYPLTREMVALGVSTAATQANRLASADRVRSLGALGPDGRLEPYWDELVHDPQTSGGLLIAVEESAAEPLLRRLHEAGFGQAAIIGEAIDPADAAPGIELLVP